MTKHILLICADQRQATRVQVALLQYGCMVEIASTFRRGLAVIEHRPPAAIVIDETLPDLDSHLLAQILATRMGCAGPAVMMLPLHTSATSQVVEMVRTRARQSLETRVQPAFGSGDAKRA